MNKKAKKQLKKLPEALQKRLESRLKELAETVNLSNVKALKGVKGLFRLRVGDYRVIYELQGNQEGILVLELGHRREIYR
ncbi:type II toxin-antitoxin system RelE family toxin [Spirulina subsalsa]|uniref:type II toxin-antitoxin system RelE family toxin n=1 Tax=Spirulina subsalsa TaxID=54311 RepID=UPI0013E046D4|nr:type II toxin-antitoxin system RelE/ParE family toxin [Spirulina subsalsa]